MVNMRDRMMYSPITDRPPISWPGGARLAVWVSPNVEHYEFVPPAGQPRDPWPMRVPHPDIREYGYRDYGNRIGFWRMLDAMDRFAIPGTASLNTAVLDRFPEIAEAMRERNWAIMSHGLYNTQYLYGTQPEAERSFYRECAEIVTRVLGREIKGMLGPAVSGTVNTPDLMAEAGLIYHCDWAHDDQPAPIRVSSGRLISVPYSFELADGPIALGARDGDYFEHICKAQFDRLYAEGAQSGRVLCIALHPFRIGLPHLIGHLEAVFEYMRGFDGVWFTTADEIAEYYVAHCFDEAVAAMSEERE